MSESISQGKPTAFLIKDKSLKNSEASFFTWLRSKGFTYGWGKGHYDVCDWVFVNITYKGASKNSLLPKFHPWLELFFENHTELS